MSNQIDNSVHMVCIHTVLSKDMFLESILKKQVNSTYVYSFLYVCDHSGGVGGITAQFDSW